MLNVRQRNSLQLVLEELLENIVLPHVQTLDLELGISEENHSSEITLQWDGPDANPMDATDEAGELARVIVNKSSTCVDYSTTEEGKRCLKVILPGD